MVSLPALISNANFVLELLALGGNIDVVGIYDGFSQVFVEARPLKATVRETSKVMEHPAENGVLIADHHIINPVEIDLSLLIPVQFYSITYTQMRQAFVDATNLSVQTKTGIYLNMVIQDLPHEESADVYDAITMFLRMKQVLLAPNAATYSPASASNQNTVLGGLKAGVALGQRALSAASGIASYANIGKFF